MTISRDFVHGPGSSEKSRDDKGIAENPKPVQSVLLELVLLDLVLLELVLRIIMCDCYLGIHRLQELVIELLNTTNNPGVAGADFAFRYKTASMSNHLELQSPSIRRMIPPTPGG